MELAEYRALYQMETSYWWYLGMREIVLSLLRCYRDGVSGLSILDAGCGTGGMTSHLAAFGQTVGIDIAPEALGYARLRGQQRLALASTDRLPFAAGSFDLVTSFDVLYHRAVPDDVGALRELWRVLRPDGLLLLRVPAYDIFRSNHDRAVHTRHRYAAGELRAKLEQAGFCILKLSYANTLLFPLAALDKLFETFVLRSFTQAPLRRTPFPFLNTLFRHILSLEARLLPRMDLPFGLSLFCCALRGKGCAAKGATVAAGAE